MHTHCDTTWLICYLESLSCNDRRTIHYEKSVGRFRFGNGETFNSLKKVLLLLYLGGIRAQILSDVVECQIPHLLSKNSLKRGEGSIIFVQDTIILLKQKLQLETSTTGHYFIQLARSTDLPVADLRDILSNVKTETLNETEALNSATKWHKQFAHPQPD